MEHEVTFALVGNLVGWKSYLFPDDKEWERPYAERPKMTLTVRDDEKLGEAFRRAMDEFDLEYPHGTTPIPTFAGFYRPEDEEGGLAHGTWAIAVVQADGTARWQHYSDVTYGELLGSADAGAVNGDPRRPYLVITEQVGNGYLPAWDAVTAMYDALKQVLELLQAPGGVYASYKLVQMLFRRTRKSVDVMQQHRTRWGEWGADPYTLDEWLDEKPWHSADLAPLLGCSVEEAEAVLWAFGFGVAPSGLWRRREDEAAKFMADNRALMISVGFPAADQYDKLKRVLDERTRKFIETERAPSGPEWYDLEWNKSPLPGRAAERVRSSRLFKRIRKKLKGY